MNAKLKNDSFEDIWKKITNAKKIVMTLHRSPDGDSLGSCAAMKYVLERDYGIKVKIVSYDYVGEDFMKFDYAKEVDYGVDISELDLNEYDMLLALDSAVPSQLSGKLGKNYTLPEGIFIVNIDHHNVEKGYGDLNYIDDNMCSVSSILTNKFNDLGVKFDRELGRRLVLGICTDSGFMTFDTNVEGAIKDVNFLIENGVDYLNDILRPIKYQVSLNYMRLTALLVQNLKVNNELNFGYTIVSNEQIKSLGLKDSEIRGPINELQYIGGIDFIYSIMESDNVLNGSFRSKRGVDVSIFARELGGGGHKAAAGFTLVKMPLKEAEKKVLEVIEKVGIHRVKDE